jgi:flagellin
MGIRINTNVEALNAQRNLNATAVSFGKSVEKLSSGLRINRAADDAAGLVISEKLRGQVRGLNQAVRNAQDGISMIQVGEGALNEVHSMLQRIRELAVQRANTGTVDSAGAAAIDAEADSLGVAITDVATNTTFNGVSVLGTLGAGDATFQVGANDSETFDLLTTAAGVLSTALDLATATIADIDAAIADVSTQRGAFGAAQNTLEHVVNNLSVASENMAASESRIRDLDVAAEMVAFTKTQILQQAGVAILAQANQAPQNVLSLLR